MANNGLLMLYFDLTPIRNPQIDRPGVLKFVFICFFFHQLLFEAFYVIRGKLITCHLGILKS